jgi:hypothetical protein
MRRRWWPPDDLFKQIPGQPTPTALSTTCDAGLPRHSMHTIKMRYHAFTSKAARDRLVIAEVTGRLHLGSDALHAGDAIDAGVGAEVIAVETDRSTTVVKTARMSKVPRTIAATPLRRRRACFWGGPARTACAEPAAGGIKAGGASAPHEESPRKAAIVRQFRAPFRIEQLPKPERALSEK